MINKKLRTRLELYPTKKNKKIWEKKAKKEKKSLSQYIEKCLEVIHTLEL